ncbi:hypothetical protein AVEN_93357-1, partial [Araneus ventricosus]
GVPQGSCSGLFFWKIVLDTALDEELPEGCFLQAFADDLILVVRGNTKAELEERGTLALARLIIWGSKHKLSFNASKTILHPSTFGGRLTLLDPPKVRMNDTIYLLLKLSLLGVWWDSSLTFTEHFKRIRRKVDLLSYRLSTRPIPFRHNPTGWDIEIFTDVSKMDSRVGSSVVVYYHGQEVYHNECRISDHASVFQAQIQGIDMVLEFVQNTVSWGRVCIFSDSLSLLKALAAIKNSNPHVWRLKQKSLTIL